LPCDQQPGRPGTLIAYPSLLSFIVTLYFIGISQAFSAIYYNPKAGINVGALLAAPSPQGSASPAPTCEHFVYCFSLG
jgi:hypothetical protein